MLKKALISLSIVCFFFVTGCATIAYKDIEASGYGISYKSTVAIEPTDIPAFIRAVDRLEKMILKMEKEKAE